MRKKELVKFEERKRQQNVGRWVTVGVFGVALAITLGFWWQGRLGKKAKGWVEPEAVVVRQNPEVRSQNSEVMKDKQVDSSELKSQIESLVVGKKGRYVVYAKSLKGARSQKSEFRSWELEVGPEGEGFMDEPMQAASLIKLPVMVAVYRMAERGELDLDEIYKLRGADRVGGSGSLMGKPDGYEVSWRRLVWHMGNESDNTAFAAVVNHFGEDKLQSEFEKMGLLQVSIAENEITPGEVAKLLNCLGVYDCVEKNGAEEILESMVETWYEDRIPKGIQNSKFKIQNEGEVDFRIAHKVGTEIGVIGDAGIVFGGQPYMLVMMTEEVRESEAREVVVEISRVVWEWVEKIDADNS